MTDDNVRPTTGSSREPEPKQPDEPVSPDETAGTEQPAETELVGKTEVNGPEGATVETLDDEPAASKDDADAAPGGTLVGETEPVVEAGAETEEAPPSGPSEGERVAYADGEPAMPAGGETAALVETPAAPEAEAPAAVPGGAMAVTEERRDVFTWHPDHKGKTFDEVRATLAQDIAADQRQHRLAMDGAEESEQEALASVVSLERKWGPYDFDWAEQEPDDLADRIVEFERERERRRTMISWSDYRNAGAAVDETQDTGERQPELSTSAKGLSLLLVVLLIVVILLAVWAL